MNWYIVLALAVPFLFLVGVVYSAIKEQKVLEDGQLKKVLAERHAKGLINKHGTYDDEDDYGVPARKDLQRSQSEQQSQSESQSEPQGHQAESSSSPAEEQRTQNDGALEPNNEPKRYESLGNTEARDAASYFAKYYK
ncbi:MAG: hypothetical protein ROM54_00265 [Anaerobiospirillum sp.]|nr:hypothetical protein [Anaerobiospirillum sp.]